MCWVALFRFVVCYCDVLFVSFYLLFLVCSVRNVMCWYTFVVCCCVWFGFVVQCVVFVCCVCVCVFVCL